MRHLVMLAVAALLSVGLVAGGAPLPLDNISIADNDQTGTKDCKGGSASIMGNDNTLTLKGCVKVSVMGNTNKLTLEGCKTLQVMGNDNTVAAGVVSSISTTGNDNTVTYKVPPKGKKPAISNLGNNNTVSQAK